jgi:hypothetical protein
VFVAHCSRLLEELSAQRRETDEIKRAKDRVRYSVVVVVWSDRNPGLTSDRHLQVIATLQRDRLNYEMVIVRQKKELYRLSSSLSAAMSGNIDTEALLNASGLSSGLEDSAGSIGIRTPPRRDRIPPSALISPAVSQLSSQVLRTPVRGSPPSPHDTNSKQ